MNLAGLKLVSGRVGGLDPEIVTMNSSACAPTRGPLIRTVVFFALAFLVFPFFFRHGLNGGQRTLGIILLLGCEASLVECVWRAWKSGDRDFLDRAAIPLGVTLMLTGAGIYSVVMTLSDPNSRWQGYRYDPMTTIWLLLGHVALLAGWMLWASRRLAEMGHGKLTPPALTSLGCAAAVLLTTVSAIFNMLPLPRSDGAAIGLVITLVMLLIGADARAAAVYLHWPNQVEPSQAESPSL